VSGTVVEYETGNPLVGATVSLGAGPSAEEGRGSRVTGDDGRFSFAVVPPGTYRISVTNQGYQEMRDTLQVGARDDMNVVLRLSTEVIALEPIILPVERPDVGRRAYQARTYHGGGFLVTRDEILSRRPRFLSELLHRVPGGMVVPTPPHGYTLLLRGQCMPGIWVDGVPMQGVRSIDQILTPGEVEAVEVFHGFEMPVEFGVHSCGGILAWTRRGQSLSGPGQAEEDEGRGFLGTLVTLVGLAAVILIVAR
jgi:hypothetical protein